MKIILKNSSGDELSTIDQPTRQDALAIMTRDWLPDLQEGDTIAIIRVYQEA